MSLQTGSCWVWPWPTRSWALRRSALRPSSVRVAREHRGNRFLSVYDSLRYPSRMNVERAKYLVLAPWCVAVLLTILTGLSVITDIQLVYEPISISTTVITLALNVYILKAAIKQRNAIKMLHGGMSRPDIRGRWGGSIVCGCAWSSSPAPLSPAVSRPWSSWPRIRRQRIVLSLHHSSAKLRGPILWP